MSNARPIGVFDSGIGGLTVVRALSHRLPHENIVYFGDTARVPYGPKSPQVVREYAPAYSLPRKDERHPLAIHRQCSGNL